MKKEQAAPMDMKRDIEKNFYYFDPDTQSFDRLIHVLQSAKELTAKLPDRSGGRQHRV